MVQLIATVTGRIRETTGLEVVVLSGGVFLNALLSSEVTKWLSGEGFHVYRHQMVPPNDGGLSLGQLVIAAWQFQPMANHYIEMRSARCASESPAR